MNENESKSNAGENSSSEAMSRAERIKAIQNAIRSNEEYNEPPKEIVHKEDVQKKMAVKNAPKKSNGKKSSGKKGTGSKKKKKKKKTLGQWFRGFFPEKGDSVLEILRKIVFLISIIAIIVCGYMVGDYYIDLWRSRMQYNDISDIYNTYQPIHTTVYEEPEDEKYYTLLDGAQKLLDINPDTVGYLRVLSKDADPIIELPVVQANDNMKYLDRNFKGDESRAGTLFLDFRNHFDKVQDHHLVEKNSDNLVIYGHNMADESMFGKLKYYQINDNFYSEHPIIQFNSNYESYTYKIFAFFVVDALDESETKYDCWNQLELDSEEAFYDFVNEAKKRTLRTNDVDVKYGDSLLTLSTCTYVLNDRSRLMLMARRVRPGEDMYEGTEKSKANKNIKWPSMYYNTKPNERYDENALFIPYGPEEAVKEAQAKAEAEKKKKEEKKKQSETTTASHKEKEN